MRSKENGELQKYIFCIYHLAYKVYVEILKEENGGEIRDEGFDTEKSKRF